MQVLAMRFSEDLPTVEPVPITTDGSTADTEPPPTGLTAHPRDLMEGTGLVATRSVAPSQGV